MERVEPQARRIAVLTGGHGRGSNLKAIHQYFEATGYAARVALVVADRADTPVKELCQSLGLRFEYVPSRDMHTYEARLSDMIKEAGIELVALAGFLRLLSAKFLSAIGVPVLNIHPALIPKHCGAGMYGMRVHQSVFVAGDKHSGATVHEVDAIYDHGRIIAQEMVDVSSCHSPEEIASLVLAAEHRIYGPAIIKKLSELSP